LSGAQVGLHLLNARKLVGQFLNSADFGLLVDCNIGFPEVGERPLQMGADDGIHAMLVQPGAQIDIGGLKLAEQHLPQPFETI
jgi:hypothetical protein